LASFLGVAIEVHSLALKLCVGDVGDEVRSAGSV
jgi:hypothetical protein